MPSAAESAAKRMMGVKGINSEDNTVAQNGSTTESGPGQSPEHKSTVSSPSHTTASKVPSRPSSPSFSPLTLSALAL